MLRAQQRDSSDVGDSGPLTTDIVMPSRTSANPESTIASSSPNDSDARAFEAPNSLTNVGFAESDALSPGLNFNEFPDDYLSGITLGEGRWRMKIGGYVKADLIHDFRAIDSRDTFDPSSIPVGEPQRTSTRFHARQTRLNMDSRWITNTGEPLRFLIEGDFFGERDTFRLRHAYGEYEGWILGQTWTTFTHRAALPNTLDVVGDVASVGRRQTQVRYKKHLFDERFTIAAAIEDSTVLVEENLLARGTPRSPLPDFICRLRFNGDNSQIQLAGLVRQLGFQPNDSEVLTRNGSGLNATGYVDVTSRSRFYGGILWGDGIGNYRDLPDLALLTPTTGTSLESLAWYSGATHQWSKRWSSNLTYSQGNVENTPEQLESSIRRLQYFAVNLIWQPTQHTFAGVEYLWGSRLNLNSEGQDASRIMTSFGFLLP